MSLSQGSQDRSNSFFMLSVTEFVLILAFVFLVLATAFQAQKIKIETTNHDAKEIQLEIEQLVVLVNDLSKKLSLGEITPSSTEKTLREITSRLSEINRYITAPIDISEDWDTLVLIEGVMDQSGISVSDVQALTETQSELEGLKKLLRETRADILSCASEFENQRKRCGTGYPICGGTGNFLAKLVFMDHTVDVEVLSSIPGISPSFENKEYDYRLFKDIGDQYFDYSAMRLPECRFQVQVVDKTSATSKAAYKLAIDAVDDRFYKIEAAR